jgi:class 3 adenylate cyclase
VADGGVTASASCGGCGAEFHAGAKFCHDCGTSLAPSIGRAEYKQVTVLFADVVGSMDIAAAVGAERLREIMTELVRALSTVVHRYGGTVDKFTGDGLMAVFGAPITLEDHAFRACLAALDIQSASRRIAADITRRDGLVLRLRIGLNSGEVIAGDVGDGPSSYTAIGEQVGMAQRMESVAPPGGVMVSESTARLVRDTAMLGEPEMVLIKGASTPVPARRLVRAATHRNQSRRSDPTLVGRGWELGSVAGILGEACEGAGSVVAVVGPPGIGKSRIVRESVTVAADRGIKVVTAHCESHTSDIPFRVVADLLRAALGIGDVDGEDDVDDEIARARVRARVPDGHPEDLSLLEDLLGVADPTTARPDIDADARRRRLTALINDQSMSRVEPVVFVIEDAHWIDDASESMLAEILPAIPHTRSLVLITYRPEYRGALAAMQGAHTINLKPLTGNQSRELIGELLGRHQSVQSLIERVAERAAGNPFFAEEMVRDLSERDVLSGSRGDYRTSADISDIDVPSTLQTTIAARIDRLDADAKRTLRAAAVVGSRFSTDLLERLGVLPTFDELVEVELVEQVQFYPRAEFAFRHPLVRAVAYESQLRSDRAELHRRLATVLEERDAGSDEMAAQIAEHLDAAGDLHLAFRWYMRAGRWLTNRDIVAARASWRRARDVADSLPSDDENALERRIDPRRLLCASAFRGESSLTDTGFDELRELCEAAGDKVSLAVGMAGMAVTLTLLSRHRDASLLATEHAALLDSIDDPTTTVALLHGAMVAKYHAGEIGQARLLAQRVIDLAEGDVARGEVLIGSPLAQATMIRGFARASAGQPDWADDFEQAMELARMSDSATRVIVAAYPYGMLIQNEAFIPDATTVSRTAEALRVAERSGDDFTLTMAQFAHGIVLLRIPGADHAFGADLLEGARVSVRRHDNVFGALPARIGLAVHQSRTGDIDGAIDAARAIVGEIADTGEVIMRGPVTVALVIEQLAAVPTEPEFVLFTLPLLRLRALVARARGNEVVYGELRDQYAVMANRVRFRGHIALAAAMD